MNSDDRKPIALPAPPTPGDPPARSPTTLPPEIQDAAAERRREVQEQEAAEREASERWKWEQRQVRVIDADTAARRGQGNATLARSACITGGATIAGFLLGGPVGAVLGCAAGWIGNRFIGAR